MRYYSFVITLILLGFLSCSSFQAKAQAETTTYKFVSADSTLKVPVQFIKKRAVSMYDTGTGSTEKAAWGYGYGFGYTSLHLEFESKTPLTQMYWKHLNTHKFCDFLIEFYDRKDQLLFSKECFNSNDINIIEAKNKRTYGMINLKGIPKTLINDTRKINIIKVLSKKNK
ncbi:hypothetical protein EMN47_09360 [Prolixibacteraceae bacterium JC049]|nr:hypothetical protein [Prolixibacteraceae bacterium JC049]